MSYLTCVFVKVVHVIGPTVHIPLLQNDFDSSGLLFTAGLICSNTAAVTMVTRWLLPW